MKAVLAVALFAAALPAQDADPRCKDRSGVAWVHPFAEALKKAKASGRLLLIKPIAFGTTADGGW